MTEQEDSARDALAVGRADATTQRRTAMYQHVSRRLDALQRGYLENTSSAVAALAKLRRGVGKQPGDLIELAEWTAPGLFIVDYDSDEVTPEEQSAHAAMTLYALHQQSHRNEGMHRSGRSFGAAARELRLKLGERGEAGVLRRFNAIGTATDSTELMRHARGLIQQFRTNDIWMDYALFADDLLKLMNPATAADVRNRWGRHFYRPQRNSATETQPSTTGDAAADAAD